MKRMIFSLIGLVILTACANQETIMRNATGEARYCYLVHGSGFEKVAATAEYTKCLNDAGAAGFKRVDK